MHNNGGGHLNHTMFWQIMSPAGGLDNRQGLSQKLIAFGSFGGTKSS